MNRRRQAQITNVMGATVEEQQLGESLNGKI